MPPTRTPPNAGRFHRVRNGTGAPLVYPAQVPPSGMLPDVSVEVRVRQGVLGFLGARSRTTFSDRRIAATTWALNGESAKGAYSITSRVEFRAYAWGVRVRRTRFRSEETVDPEKGLLQHVLRREDGGYSALRRLSPTSGELEDGPHVSPQRVHADGTAIGAAGWR